MTMRRTLRAAVADTSGVTAVEFALSLPLLMLMAMGGLEIANMAIVHMRINQIAVSLADNASRMKQSSTNGEPRFREVDANEALKAAEQQGADLKLVENGRVILSSLQTNATGGQTIQWQRCTGQKTSYTSDYGTQGTGAVGNAYAGMGPAGKEVTAESGEAIMVAEVVYNYRPLILDRLYDNLVVRKYLSLIHI